MSSLNYLAPTLHFLQNPALKAVLFFALGLLLGYAYPTTLFYALTALPPVFMFLWGSLSPANNCLTRWASYFATSILFVAGAFYSSWSYNGLTEKIAPDGDTLIWEVKETPRLIKSGVRIKAVALEPHSLSEYAVLLYTPRSPFTIKTGDTIYTSSVNLDLLECLQRKGYKNYLIAQECSAIGYVDTFSIIPREGAHSLETFAVDVRKNLLGRLEQLTLTPLQKEMLSAMSLGYKAESITAETLFRKSGAIHILSVSGFHLAVVCYFIALLLFPLRRSRRWSYVAIGVQIIVAWLFVALTGFSAPAIRAAVMLAFYQFALLLKRPANGINIISFSALVLLLIKPSYILDIGFQLSYLAVFSIALFYPLFIRSIPQIGNFVLRYLYQSIALCISAQLLTTPLILYHFGEFSLLSLWSNIPLIFLSSVLIPLSLIYMLFSPWSLIISFLGKGVEILVAMVENVVTLFAPLEGISVKESISAGQSLGLYCIIIALYIGWSYWIYRKEGKRIPA
ncbi:ComEC/Rec2 family competence protein [Porphyromonas circumdentaria]|uniref:ComEC/Rec2 family competence protein n=1 Tax=Porphyromonas circumdentaria TaxID=29524 RepID=UPI0026DD8E1A|nr:ComEC/Rec2 family competence protein [Porphyromonas circumdentaria]MDO4722736.1 ComEC/Rec2 family competence protein [Porphyromonas circumdentaria]